MLTGCRSMRYRHLLSKLLRELPCDSYDPTQIGEIIAHAIHDGQWQDSYFVLTYEDEAHTFNVRVK